MLTRPAISDDSIKARLRENFGLHVSAVTFLPIGADANSAAFRVVAGDGTVYFLKLRRGSANDVPVAVPAFLRARGIRAVMAPIATASGGLWAQAQGCHWILYPFFAGSNGFEAALSRAQWVTLGRCLRAVHATILPAGLAERVPREDFDSRLRRRVRVFALEAPRHAAGDDPSAAGLAALWLARRDEIRCIVDRAEELGRAMQQRAGDLVLCHADLHGGNVLVGAGDELAIVDWDDTILAPKERDLMFVGGGVGAVWNEEREVAWFYEGYGPTAIAAVALAYYRYERIVADIAAYAGQIFARQGSAEERAEGLCQLAEQFLPGHVIEIAHRSYP